MNKSNRTQTRPNVIADRADDRYALTHTDTDTEFLPARRYASAGNSDRNVSVRPSVRLSVCLSRAGIVSKRRKENEGLA